MRIAEKTIELNFCKGLPLALGHDLVWFGLTQKQEAKAGFDACARYHSTLLLFQIKASRVVLKNGARRFLANHEQMQTLRGQVKITRHVFYVLPVIGTTPEICNGLCFSHCSRYLDVSQLPSTIPKPTARGKTPPSSRKSNCHYIDMDHGLLTATIHSEPFTANLLNANELKSRLNLSDIGLDLAASRAHGESTPSSYTEFNEFHEFWSALSTVDRTGLIGAFPV